VAPVTSFAVAFLGCKVSLSDAQEVRERLLADGHEEGDGAAVRVVNTCCVTAEALAKSRKAVRRAARTAEAVYVTGCAASLPGRPFAGLADNVHVLPGPAERAAEAIVGGLDGLGCVGGASAAFARTRAYVKVQDGCSFSCSYCVIPLVRGASRSRPAERVLAEARRRAAQGHRELVLTGINLGCFRDRAAGFDLARLLCEVADLEGVERVRLSSIEVNHLGERLLEAMAGHPRIARHLHVPLQSGDDGVLRAMARRYGRGRFLERAARARELVPGVNLTSDVIVGHPAEDDAAFGRTLEAVEAAGFSKVHVFPYSPRPGTRDEGADTVPPPVKRRRSEELRALSDELGARRRRSLLGRRAQVLVESRSGRGYSDDYTPFRVPDAPVGRMAAVEAVATEGDALLGRLLVR
jgi:threonylcarbamoyladenosine tRNA methylthiotransferase MtaB